MSYPDNLEFWNVLRFSVIPCYCYKPDYPRRPFSAQRIIKFALICFAQAEISANLMGHIVFPVRDSKFVVNHGFFNFQNYRQFVDEIRIVVLLSVSKNVYIQKCVNTKNAVVKLELKCRLSWLTIGSCRKATVAFVI